MLNYIFKPCNVALNLSRHHPIDMYVRTVSDMVRL